MTAISVHITCSRPHRAWVDNQTTVLLHDGQVIDLAPGDHDLIWSIIGSPGDTFKAVLRDGGREVCNVDWSIPAGSSGWTGDLEPFTV
ncbi:hypothetical protein ASD21_00435 [Caulobacter sp. Root1455]|jgi:hypothetical protein|uniref:hypothetical protein n=1 Tax=unclassified Caulobacter TaxID=2648921 RepID=UPI0006FE772D|nr:MULTISPECIES: hypothetical protein [unclassified Caulobacter]KQY35879.1 hypothetical protein ASD38_04870 [Caulobacter sp. Root487D2Y]KQZ06145.1 hypothetical protein ASD21_00435 [Caulobacter sp. Root1455]